MMKKILLVAIFSCAFIFSSKSQDFLGYINSNYSGVTGTDLNPAAVVDSRYKVDISLAGTSLSVYNNYVGMKRSALKHNGKLFAFGDSTNYTAFNDKDFQKNYLDTRNNSKTKSVYLDNQIYLPSFMVTLNKINAIAFKWKVRTMMNIDGVEPDLASQIYAGLKDSAQWTNRLQNKRLSIQTMSWAEYGVTFGHVFQAEGKNFLKAAVTVKLIQGLQAAYMFVDNFDYNFTNDTTLSVFHSDISYGHSTNFDFSDKNNIKYKYVSNPSVGLDIGAVYEWRPDFEKYKYDMDGETGLNRKDKNKYKLRVGVSVVDIGSVKFKKGPESHNFSADVSYWDIHNLPIKGVPSFDSVMKNKFSMETQPSTFKMNLPTAFSAQVDYNIYKDFYANFTAFYALQFKNDRTKVHDLTTFSFSPRWDHKWFGVFVPVSYDLTGNTKIGLDLRAGPLIIGTNSLGILVTKKDIYGLDFHVLLKIPIMYNRPKDKDKDKVSDGKDKCKEVPGTWEFMGCPDRDGDHIQDKDDACPDEPGIPKFNGCPDRDGDGIMDKQDACPDDPGLPEFNGCPDKDGDKIIDKEDDCPDEPGLPAFKGCPDRDGDGVMDKIDECPDKPGPASNNGCPEVKLTLINSQGTSLKTATMAKDSSFTFDELPADEFVIFNLEGENTDGIKEVKVMVGGIAKKALRDTKDKYFRFIVLKPDDNKLKPDDNKDVAIKLNEEEAEVLKKAFNNLEFATAKDIIKNESFASLDELAVLMAKKPLWKLKVSGHTDNQGDKAKNLKLSEKRSKAVQAYLVSKGIDANRFKVEWFGSTKPIASNKTEEGRQKNRRVEMLIIE